MVRNHHSPSLWDSIADRYDGLRPDQGLTDPAVRRAWAVLLGGHIPASHSRILDVGCGTGSLSLLLSEAGHTVIGIDFAPAMISVARAKAQAAGANVMFEVQDAAAPRFPPASFEAIVSRQVLWALPDRQAALRNWADLLRPSHRLCPNQKSSILGRSRTSGAALSLISASWSSRRGSA